MVARKQNSGIVLFELGHTYTAAINYNTHQRQLEFFTTVFGDTPTLDLNWRNR